MPDPIPDPAGGESAAPTPQARRAGLDRLRAARGGAPQSTADAPGGNPEPQSRGGGAGRDSGAAGGGTEAAVGGATTLLDTPDDLESVAAPHTTEEPASPDAAQEKKARRRRRARAAAETEGSAGERRPGRAGRATTTGATPSDVRPDQRSKILAVGLVVLVVALLIPVIAMRHRVFGQSKEQKAVTDLVDKQTEALAEARRFAVTFFSPDYKTIDQYSDQIAAQSTGKFNQDFASKRGELKSLLTKVQSQASGRVLAAGVSKVSGNDVEVLIVADQDVKNTTSQGKTVTNRYRVRVSVQKTPKGFLVTDLEPVV